MEHPTTSLDDVVHQRTRLGIMALLGQTDSVDFGTLRDELGVTDGNLSQHLRVLEEAAYVKIEKGYEGRRPRTWLAITKEGNRALLREMELLRQIAASGPHAPSRPAGKAKAAAPSRSKSGQASKNA